MLQDECLCNNAGETRSECDSQRSNGIDPRNKLNDLTNKDWMISTKSVWKSASSIGSQDALSDDDLVTFAEWLRQRKGTQYAESLLGQLLPSVVHSRPPARDSLKSQHPATFAEKDIERLILFFTKKGETVLDPFVGSGSTLVACRTTGRNGVGIELVPKWADIARKRTQADELPLFQGLEVDQRSQQHVLEGDARAVLKSLEDESFDFVVTSPPYWKILHKDSDHKVTRERLQKGLETRYSEMDADLGNVAAYDDFLGELRSVFMECRRVLKTSKYMAVIVSDFRDRGKFISYHSDISNVIEHAGLTLQGITILVQDSKNLYPYGIPYAFVSNINHQYILVFRKNGVARSDG
jgi:DNA modification methylase